MRENGVERHLLLLQQTVQDRADRQGRRSAAQLRLRQRVRLLLWRGSLEKATVALQAVSFAVSSRSGQVGLSSYHGGLVVGHEGLSAHVPPLSTAARIVCSASTDLVVSAMVVTVSAKVEQSALLPPDLSMAEMEVTMVCRPRQHIRHHLLQHENDEQTTQTGSVWQRSITSGTTRSVAEGRASHLYAARATRTRSLRAMVVLCVII